jgi:hypothetical protein
MRLDPESLQITTFEPSAAMSIGGTGGGYCCTGCDSGCGINPTAGGCESGGQTFKDFACGADLPRDAEIARADAAY